MTLDNLTAGIDIGSNKVKVVIGKINKDKIIRYIGIGECSSMGIRKGKIVDIDNAVKAIEWAFEKAQNMAGLKIEMVYVNSTADPSQDEQKESIQNVINSLSRLGLSIKEMVLNPVAAAEAVLTEDEKKQGVILLDIGAETSGFALYHKGALAHAAILPIGGRHITQDLAFGLRITPEEAEEIKVASGCVMAEIAAEYDFIKIGNTREKRKVSRKLIADIIQPRVEEIFCLVKKNIYDNNCPKEKLAVVLTGGTSLLPGVSELAERVFDWPTILATDEKVARPAHDMNKPTFATAIGLVRHGLDGYKPKVPETGNGFFGHVKKWLREYI